MKAEIITIGDELLIGETINTNASFIGSHLVRIGVDPRWVTVVGDSIDEMLEAMRIALERAHLVLITGGLGPTHDDVTKTALCRFFKKELVFNKHVMDAVEAIFKRAGRVMPDLVRNQAYYPESARLLNNSCGSAWGIMFEQNKKILIAMPGVPREMKTMLQNEVIPILEPLAQDLIVKIKTYRTNGIIESDLSTRLQNLDQILEKAAVAFLPGPSGVNVRITLRTHDQAAASSDMAMIDQLIHEQIGEWIYAEEGQLLEEILGQLCIRKGLTLSTAESCTGGLVASMITDVPGSSEYFRGGITAYSNDVKIKSLGISQSLLLQHGAVSEEVAQCMAENVREVMGSDIGLSTTGIAGPAGGSKEKPLGLVWIACSYAETTKTERFIFGDNRKNNKERFANAVLNLARRSILKDFSV